MPNSKTIPKLKKKKKMLKDNKRGKRLSQILDGKLLDLQIS